MTFNTEFAKGITRFRKVAPTAQKGYIVYAGDLTPDLPHARVLRLTRSQDYSDEDPMPLDLEVAGPGSRKPRQVTRMNKTELDPAWESS